MLVARLSNLLILAIALAIMANLGSIQAAWHVSLLFGAGMGAVLVLRWLWERVNLWSEMAAIAASLVVAPVLLVSVDAEWLKLLLMAGLTTAAMLLVTWLTLETEHEVLDRFYARVRPPGLWGRTAARVGEPRRAPRRRLRRGAWLVFTTAASVYLLLVGVVKLLVPPPGAAPWAAWLYVLAGVACCALWWRPVTRAGMAVEE